MFIKDKLYLDISNAIPNIKCAKINKFLITNIIDTVSFDEMLKIFDDAITHGFEIIIEDGKFYYLE